MAGTIAIITIITAIKAQKTCAASAPNVRGRLTAQHKKDDE